MHRRSPAALSGSYRNHESSNHQTRPNARINKRREELPLTLPWKERCKRIQCFPGCKPAVWFFMFYFSLERSSVVRFNLISPTKKDCRNPQSFRQSFFCFLFCYFGFSLSIFLFFFPFPTFLFPSSTPSPRRWRRSGRIRQQGSLPFPSSYGFRLPL